MFLTLRSWFYHSGMKIKGSGEGQVYSTLLKGALQHSLQAKG